MYPYTGPKLIQLLEHQHRVRAQSGLFKSETFTLRWRTKVGSFPHPDLETLVSAGEPCGNWQPEVGRPEDKRQVKQNWDLLRELPLHGYIPGSSIRGVVRAWAKAWVSQRPHIYTRMLELLGQQEGEQISPGKIEFLDAWPLEPTVLTLDIVNPQQRFQVYHAGQGEPVSLYTLGDGDTGVPVIIAIRATSNQVEESDVQEVWEWVQQALSLYGLGSRTASGYGAIKPPSGFKPSSTIRGLAQGYSEKLLSFSLYSQGNAGPNLSTPELRPSHWRGWLRSWLLRFFLGVMPQENAELTVAELMGGLEPETHRGCVRLQMIQGSNWNEKSEMQPHFYSWEGTLRVMAPSEILSGIIIPIIRFAVMSGGVGRGWRRPLHIFQMRNGRDAARGCHLKITHKVPQQGSSERTTKPFGLKLASEDWDTLYDSWRSAVAEQWGNRIAPDITHNAEVFSPTACAVYLLPGPSVDPLNTRDLEWYTTEGRYTRGQGMHLIYNPRYKGQIQVGGDAAQGGASHCSWASIKRLKAISDIDSECQEVVCLFLGHPQPLRLQFLSELSRIPGSVHIFGCRPD